MNGFAMRNSPYAVHTLGHSDHQIVPVGKTKGLIQGIVKLGEAREIDASAIKDFGYLPAGKKEVFKHGADVEVVSFDGYLSRYGFSSYIQRRRLKLEDGAILTGPVVWRSAPAEPEENSHSPYAGPLAFGFGVLVLGIFTGILSLISAKIALPFGGVSALCLILFLIQIPLDKRKNRSIERQGSVYVLAPANGDAATSGTPVAA